MTNIHQRENLIQQIIQSIQIQENFCITYVEF